MRKEKCGIYLRLSKEDSKNLLNDESVSIKGQRMIITSFCSFNNIDIACEYVDDGYSGSNFDRPGFKKMIKDIESGKINLVITKDLSRLGRELYKTGSYIEDYFNDKNVRYIAINDGYDSFKENDGSISMKLAYNDYVLRDTSRKVRSSLTARRKNGQYIGSIAKYGYIKDPKDHHHLIKDTTAAIIVKKIFDMALQGNTCYKIASILTEEKIPIPIIYKGETRGANITDNDGCGIWKVQTVKDILTSEMYTGTMVQNIWTKVRYNSKKLRRLDEQDYIKVENTHEAIIDKDTFDRVQEIVKKEKGVLSKSKKIYLFSGLLYCKECGHRISILERKNKKDNSHYTQCSMYSKKGKYGVCNIHRVNYNQLEDDLILIIKRVCKSYLHKYDNKLLTEEINNIMCEEEINLQKEIDSLTLEITKYGKVIEGLYMDKTLGKVPENVFDRLLMTYNESLNRCIDSKNELDEKKEQIMEKNKKVDYENCAKFITNYLSQQTPTRSLIIALVDKVEIDNEKNIKIYFNFPELSYVLS